MDRGVEAFQNGNIEEALGHFTIAIDEYNANSSKSWTSRISRSSTRFTKTVITKAKLAALYTNQGLCRHYLGEVEGSLVSFTTALTLAPDSRTALFNRGIANHDLGNLDDALKDFKKAQSLDHTLLPAIYGEAWVLTDQTKYAEAIKVVDHAEQVEKAQPTYDAMIEYRKRESLISFNRSVPRRSKSMGSDPLDAAPAARTTSNQAGSQSLCDAHFIRSFSYLHLDRPEEALVQCKRGIDILGDTRFPTLELCLCCLVKTSVVMQKRGMVEAAIKQMDEAVQMAMKM